MTVVQWVELATHFQLREPRFQLSGSLSCISEYLATDSGGYLCTNSYHALIAARLNTSQKSLDPPLSIARYTFIQLSGLVPSRVKKLDPAANDSDLC